MISRMTAAEAASLIKNGDQIAMSGFTPAGVAKATTKELAKKAQAEHDAGRDFKVSIFTGASTGQSTDGDLANAQALKYRAPYTTNPDFRKHVNMGEIPYNDLHLSHMAQELRYGFYGDIDWAILEVCDIEDAGSGEVDAPVVAGVLNVADLEDGPVDIAVESIAQFLCHVAQVQVVVGNLASIHMLTEIGVRGVGSTIEDSLGVGQITVGRLSSGSTCEDSHLELAASLVFSHRNLCQLLGCSLSHTSRSKATHGDMVAILNQRCCLGSGHTCVHKLAI